MYEFRRSVGSDVTKFSVSRENHRFQWQASSNERLLERETGEIGEIGLANSTFPLENGVGFLLKSGPTQCVL